MSLGELTAALKEHSSRKLEVTRIRHILMTAYGWIPEKEFYEESSIAEVSKLMKYIKEDSERMENKLKKK